MRDAPSGVSITFNGEIYNHRDLRADLQRKGHVFRTGTDTEVVLALYKEKGKDCVRDLHGMFAFAILDGNTMFLARDRMGIKPLRYTYVAEQGLFLFGSEIKALLQCSRFIPKLNREAFADFVVFGNPAGTSTFFEGVRTLPPGNTMEISWKGTQLTVGEPEAYFTLTFARNDSLDFNEAEKQLDRALSQAVETHMSADVEVSITLSGGIDSTLLALIAHEQKSQPIRTFSVSDDEHHPDALLAAYVAKSIGSNHTSTLMTFDDYLESIPKIIAAHERPSSLLHSPWQFLSRTVSKYTKATLCGEGADELFGGYPEYVDQNYMLAPILKRVPRVERLDTPMSARASENLRKLATTDQNEYLAHIFAMNQTDQLTWLHLDVDDSIPMASGVEVRVPYMDDQVVSVVNQFPVDFLVNRTLEIQKYILKRFCLDRFGSTYADVILRKKHGMPSVGLRLRSRFDALCEEILPAQYLAGHELGYCFASKRELLIFELFEDIFFTNRGDVRQTGSLLDFMRSRGA